MLTKAAIEEFREIYQRKYGVALSDAETTEMASNLLNLYRSVYSLANNSENKSDESLESKKCQ